MVVNKVFLSWLLYCVLVIFVLGALWRLGIPQIAYRYDKSYLGLGLTVMWILAEIFSFWHAILVSREQKTAGKLSSFVELGKLVGLETVSNTVSISSELPNGTLNLISFSNSSVASHLTALIKKSRNSQGGKIDQNLMLDIATERLRARTSASEFLSARIVWLGVFATILGVILAFWPLLTSGFNIEEIKGNLGGFFGGIAVAFIPTAISFLYKVALDFESRIISSGVEETMDELAMVCETHIIPYLESSNVQTPSILRQAFRS